MICGAKDEMRRRMICGAKDEMRRRMICGAKDEMICGAKNEMEMMCGAVWYITSAPECSQSAPRVLPRAAHVLPTWGATLL